MPSEVRLLPSFVRIVAGDSGGACHVNYGRGLFKNGVVVPNAPLPEGAFVEVHVINGPIEVPPELQEEFDAWDRASARALESVERLAAEGTADAKG
jgi:hypothetical protein